MPFILVLIPAPINKAVDKWVLGTPNFLCEDVAHSAQHTPAYDVCKLAPGGERGCMDVGQVWREECNGWSKLDEEECTCGTDAWKGRVYMSEARGEDMVYIRGVECVGEEWCAWKRWNVHEARRTCVYIEGAECA